MANSLASPTESMVKEVSGLLAEPEEISRERSVALDYFNKLPIEKSQLYTKYVDILSGLNLDSIELGLPSNSRNIPVESLTRLRKGTSQQLHWQVILRLFGPKSIAPWGRKESSSQNAK